MDEKAQIFKEVEGLRRIRGSLGGIKSITHLHCSFKPFPEIFV